MVSIIEGKIPIYGKRVPSTHQEQLSKDDLSQHTIVAGGMRFEHIFPNDPPYLSDPVVRSTDLDGLIVDMHFQSGFED